MYHLSCARNLAQYNPQATGASWLWESGSLGLIQRSLRIDNRQNISLLSTDKPSIITWNKPLSVSLVRKYWRPVFCLFFFLVYVFSCNTKFWLRWLSDAWQKAVLSLLNHHVQRSKLTWDSEPRLQLTSCFLEDSSVMEPETKTLKLSPSASLGIQ